MRLTKEAQRIFKGKIVGYKMRTGARVLVMPRIEGADKFGNMVISTVRLERSGSWLRPERVK